MLVLPECDIRPLNDCPPGAALRLLSHGGQFAIVGDGDDSEYRVLITFEADGPSLEFVEKSDTFKVLCFTGDCILDVDQRGPFEPPLRTMYEKPGCLIREPSRWLLNVRLARSSRRYERAQFDLTNHKVLPRISDRLNNIAVFGAWKLYLGQHDRPREEWTEIAAHAWSAAETTS
jgi:hypothetical protein